jgi:hypothetical protein
MNSIPCMGGWCAHKREHCAHYHSDSSRKPNERLCEPGMSDAFRPMLPWQKGITKQREAQPA